MKVLISKRQHFTCYENIIAFLSEKYNLQYEVIFAKMWDFEFDLSDKEKMVSDRMTGDFDLAMDYLTEYTGLAFTVNEEPSFRLISKCQKEVLEGRYVIIPSFRQKILEKYREVDGKPTTILMIVRIVADEVECVDIHGDVNDDGYMKIVRIKDEDFIDGIDDSGQSTFITYKIENNKKNVNQRDVLDKQINKILKEDEEGRNIFQRIREFAKEMNETNISREVCEERPVEKYPIINEIKKICRARFLFNYFLEIFVSEEQSFFSDCIYEMNKIGTYWSTIMSSFIKMYYKQNYSYAKKISDMLNKVSILEEQLAREMRLYLDVGEKKNVFKENVIFKLDSSLKEVDLRSELNNKGIAVENGINAHYNELEYMYLEEKENIFKLIQIGEQGHDNIVCGGQKINLGGKKGTALFVLANSEGYRSDFIKIHYADEEEEKLLGVSNWFGEPMFSEAVVIREYEIFSVNMSSKVLL